MQGSTDLPLPPARTAVWRALLLAYRVEPKLLLASAGVTILAALLDGLFVFWLALIADAAVDGRSDLLFGAAAGLAASVAGGWLIGTVWTRVERNFRFRVRIAMEARVASLQTEIPTLEHHERPEFLDRLAVLREGVLQLGMIYGDLFGTAGALLRLGITVALLMSVHPLTAVLLVFAALPLGAASWRATAQRRAEQRAAADRRQADHLFDVATSLSAAKELRIFRTAEYVLARREQAWNAWLRPVAAARWRSAAWIVAAWATFGATYLGMVVFGVTGARVSAGGALLILAAGGRLAQYVGETAGNAGSLSQWMDAARRLAWLEDYSRRVAGDAAADAPPCLKLGMSLRDVSFRYPATDTWVLRDVSIDLPAGSVVAIVGVNGAGKSTLIKLLAQYYAPTSGEIAVDGVSLATVAPAAWRARCSGAFQDFVRFELPLREAVGIGDLPRAEDTVRVRRAVARAGADDVVTSLPGGLSAQLGGGWPAGVEVSFGQWQKIALARGFMRDEPLLLILDEPTAALDAETEHALFERFAAVARSTAGNGRITVLVSHRFSTVRTADLIVVLDGSRAVEVGTHEELLGRDGLYAELYQMQATAYR
jgi:ATP-binding cassette, subfamily B, bacterial